MNDDIFMYKRKDVFEARKKKPFLKQSHHFTYIALVRHAHGLIQELDDELRCS